jgi:predicted secreted hydrolase
MTASRWLSLLALLAIACAGLGCSRHFESARATRPIVLPSDHGAHPEFKTEWWYWNGHLRTDSGEQYDFFLSFTHHSTRGDRFFGLPILTAADPVCLALFGMTDRAHQRHSSHVKTNLVNPWAAGADASSSGAPRAIRLWHGAWKASVNAPVFELRAGEGSEAITLRLVAQKPPVLYGDHGFIDVPGASHYVYSFTDVAVDGQLGKDHPVHVSGTAWFDHFFGTITSAAFKNWDWFSIQLDDGSAYMLGRIHRDDGTTLPYANFEVSPDGKATTLPADAVTWHLRGRWTSPASDQVYRLHWTIVAPELELELDPVVDDQEIRDLPVSRFWEGAMHVRGRHHGRAVTGEAFLETIAEGGLPLTGMRFGP